VAGGVAELSFASLPASMVAGGSVLAAAHGILGHAWTDASQLVNTLQRITSVDAVRSASVVLVTKQRSLPWFSVCVRKPFASILFVLTPPEHQKPFRGCCLPI